MIIILGPDHTGKTRLAKSLGLPYYHFTKDSGYLDYLKPLVNFDLFNAVLDRHAICEYAYAICMNRKFRFSMKEWHNLLLLTLMQNPLVVLCTHKPMEYEYSREQYLPYEKWDQCMVLYKAFLTTHHIRYYEYDYLTPDPAAIQSMLMLEEKWRKQMDWWAPMWQVGYGCIGSTTPKVLLVAERIGPNNTNNLPFETGPTGKMLTDMFVATGTPLNKIAISNMVKSWRRDPRPPIPADLDLLRVEIEHLKPEKVVFMGSVAKYGMRLTKELGIPTESIVHLGYYNYKRITDMSPYHAEWRRIMEVK